MSSILTPGVVKELQDHQYPFENLVFEGGGSKGTAYIGAIRVLEEVGIWKNFKRFAGASVGSLTATWAAVGYNSHEMEKFICVNLKSKLQDSHVASFLPNIKKHFGWHQGKKFTQWVGETLESAPNGNGKADITFEELYRKCGIELCITVTNLHQQDCTYCHVKTTPDLPIKKAVRMSVAIPGMFGAVRHKMSCREELYVDGGLLCNYPITCFDGWFLSLDPRETFLQRIPTCDDLAQVWDVSNRFGTRNDKTIGILLYSQDEQEMFKIALTNRLSKYCRDSPDLEIPITGLSRKRTKERVERTTAATKRDAMSKSMSAFLKKLSANDADLSGTINKAELTTTIEQGGDDFTHADAEMLFGKGFTIDGLFKTLDTDGSGEITFRELTGFIERQGLQVLSLFRGFENREINDVASFFTSVVECMLLTMKRIFVRGEDLDRTIGIDTVYLGTLDLNMESADREFLFQQGKLGCIAFLRQYIDPNRTCSLPVDRPTTTSNHPKPEKCPETPPISNKHDKERNRAVWVVDDQLHSDPSVTEPEADDDDAHAQTTSSSSDAVQKCTEEDTSSEKPSKDTQKSISNMISS